MKTNQEVLDTMLSLGDRDTKGKILNARRGGRYSTTGPGSFLIGTMAGKLADALTMWCAANANARDYAGQRQYRVRVTDALYDIGIDKAAALSCRIIVDALAQEDGRDRHKLRARLGQALHDELRMTTALEVSPRGRYLKKYLQGKGGRSGKSGRIFNFIVDELDEKAKTAVKHWDVDIQEGVAHLILMLVLKTSGVIEARRVLTKTRKGRPKTLIRFHLKGDTESWMQTAEAAACLISPYNLPMVSKPDDWTSPVDGGYPDDFPGRRPLMSTMGNRQIRSMYESDCPDVYRAVNNLQAVQWGINETVLEVFRTAVEEGWGEGELRVPMLVDPEAPKRPPDPVKVNGKVTEEHQIYFREMRHWEHERDSRRCLGLSCSRLLYLADQYRGAPLYYVHMLDFRGRCYPLSGSLQYQGDDRQRGLLQFWNAKPIETEEAAAWFRIHGANCWGCDKLPFADRLLWYEQNRQRILDVGQDPIINRWWVEADKPWQFLAWCLEAAEFEAVGMGYQSRIPVGMDGSNNGLQLYSLLLRDPVGGAATNCVPGECPKDIYMDVARAANAVFQRTSKDLNADPDHRRWATQLLRYWPEGLPRSAVKRPVMTLPYGSTKHSCQAYITEWYHSEVRGKRLDPAPFPDKDGHQAMTYFGSVVWDRIREIVVSAVTAMEWLREVTGLVTDAGQTVTWETPSGLRVVQVYSQGKKELIRLSIGKPINFWVHKPTIQINRLKSMNGLCPNYIHSLDAALMVRTTNRAMSEGIDHLMMIHDSFASHAADAPRLAAIIREEAIRMFSGNLLEDLRLQIQDTVGIPIPPPPPQGDLNISRLKDAKYFFA